MLYYYLSDGNKTAGGDVEIPTHGQKKEAVVGLYQKQRALRYMVTCNLTVHSAYVQRESGGGGKAKLRREQGYDALNLRFRT